MMDMMRPVMLTTWAMVSQSRDVSVRRSRCSARRSDGIAGSPSLWGVVVWKIVWYLRFFTQRKKS
jgi:hypothetical protein